MSIQQAMIDRARVVSSADERLEAAMMYGSWARDEGDAHSDIEFALFFHDHALAGVDQREWASRIAPVALYFTNEFDNGTAIYEHLVRGEFHFERASDMAQVETWGETDTLPSLDLTLLLDRTGRLTKHLCKVVGLVPERDTAQRTRFLCDSFVNWTLFGSHVLERGEMVRALEILGIMGRYLLWLVRLQEHSVAHWPTPSRLVERDISPAALARYSTCTAPLDDGALRLAYRCAWKWGRELMADLGERHALALPEPLLQKLDRRLHDLAGSAAEPGRSALG